MPSDVEASLCPARGRREIPRLRSRSARNDPRSILLPLRRSHHVPAAARESGGHHSQFLTPCHQHQVHSSVEEVNGSPPRGKAEPRNPPLLVSRGRGKPPPSRARSRHRLPQALSMAAPELGTSHSTRRSCRATSRHLSAQRADEERFLGSAHAPLGMTLGRFCCPCAEATTCLPPRVNPGATIPNS